ncbi:FUSC family protein [Micromonospora sp. SL4-19]|uniref:FUSC family protein n=1 Tax=Micromonospora sp. SL4-19 TaxID=3399129 RepID=UPI003A4D2BC0
MASPGTRDERPSAQEERRDRSLPVRAFQRFRATRSVAAIAVISAQAGLATAGAWLIATDFLGRNAPVFAPVAALATIASATGQRTRQTVELLIGVGLGITVADVLLYFIGTGSWQIAVVVSSSIALGLLVAGRSGALVSQSGATATLFATLSGSQKALEVPRILDAAVGAAVGFLAVALLWPLNPLRGIDRAAKPFFETLTTAIHTAARALATGDRDLAAQALNRLNSSVTSNAAQLNEALRATEEIVTLAPWWRHLQNRYQQYRAAADQFDAFIIDARVLIRRIVTLLEYHEPVPPALHQAIEALGDAVAHLHRDCATVPAAGRARNTILEAARRAGQVDGQHAGMFGETVVLQIRSAASDLLRATGIPPEQANKQVRDAATAKT